MWISLDSAFYVNDIIYGCTDTIASNYNPTASVDNGSCMITLCDSSNYNGPEEVLFTKLPYANHHNINSRDVINASMQYQLTRNNLYNHTSNNINGIYGGVWGLFNYLSQIDASDNISNSGILYAYGDLASNSAFQGQYPFVGTNFNGWYKSLHELVSESYLSQLGSVITIYLPYDNLYFELEFYSWESPQLGSGYSYKRTWKPCVDNPLVYGCIDSLASNYNYLATYDDGSCVYLGCMDSSAVNYNPIALTDDGSCTHLISIHPNTGLRGQTIHVGIEGQNIQYNDDNPYSPLPQISGFRLSQGGNNMIYGNPIQTFANYLTGDITVSLNQPIGWYDLEVYDFASNSWVVGNNFFEVIDFIYGCTDPKSLNYDSTATIDNGTCIPILFGCMDTLASNYDSNAMVDDGSCQYIIGCTDSLAFNYDPNAVIDDSSCVPIIYGCNDVYACNYDSLANTLVPSCIYSLTPNGLFTSNIQLDRAT